MEKKDKKIVVNRKMYERIRRMDHCQLSLWAESIYKSGFKDGADAANNGALTVEQVKTVLLSIKGFGEKRVSAVCEALEQNLAPQGIDAPND